MELKKDYQKIFDDILHDYGMPTSMGDVREVVRAALLEAQALADRPPKELTDEEVTNAYNNNANGSRVAIGRAVIAAHIRALEKEKDLLTGALAEIQNLTTGYDNVAGIIKRLASNAAGRIAEFEKEIERLRVTLRGIANADIKSMKKDFGADWQEQFVRWAQSRARFALKEQDK